MHPNNAKVKMIVMTIRMISADSLYNAPPAAWQLPGCNNWLEITNRSDSSPDDDVPWVSSSSDDYSLGQIFREIIFTKFFMKFISRYQKGKKTFHHIPGNRNLRFCDF